MSRPPTRREPRNSGSVLSASPGGPRRILRTRPSTGGPADGLASRYPTYWGAIDWLTQIGYLFFRGWFTLVLATYKYVSGDAAGFEIDGSLPPAALPEPRHAEDGTRDVPEHDRQSDLAGFEAAAGLEDRAEADRHADLRDDRNDERASGIPGALQAARAGQRDGDEEAGHAQARAGPPQSIDRSNFWTCSMSAFPPQVSHSRRRAVGVQCGCRRLS